MLSKKQVYCIATILILTMISATVAIVVAHADESMSITKSGQPSPNGVINPVEEEKEPTSDVESRPPPYPTGEVVNTVEEKIKELKTQGLTDDQIVEELAKIGMWWNPSSGATGLGIFIPDDQIDRPHRIPFQHDVITSETP